MMTQLSKKNTKTIKKIDNTPHYFEVKNEDGKRYCHCGNMVDVETILSMNPNFTYEKIYLPHSPKTINVPHVRLDDDFQLPAQQTLPESELQEFVA